ncbi:MAG: endopeptidase La [Lachnospiraceae bacterium]|nr:endopeptidase La [Lachnospiraceae bacterium]
MQMYALTLKGITILPGMVIHFDIDDNGAIEAVNNAIRSDGRIFCISRKNLDAENLSMEDLYKTGTIVNVRQLTKLPNGYGRVLVEGVKRARLIGMNMEDGHLVSCEIEECEEDDGRICDDPATETAVYRLMVQKLSQYIEFFPKIGASLNARIQNNMNHRDALYRVIMNLPLTFDKKQRILDATTTGEQYEILIEILSDEVEVAAIQKKLAQDIKERVEKNQKDYILREQLAYIRKELNGENEESDAEAMTRKTRELEASDEIKARILKEIKRFEHNPENGSESSVQRNYIETLLEMPWDHSSEDDLDIDNASKVLESNHYGMEKVKERILEFLAVRLMTGKGHSPILCLVGPPGTGKTSIAKSIASALNKEYIRICLGGVRDEAEIRGHRRTYVGAMPGRIAAGLRSAGTNNPLMLLDEIDKVSNDYRGDTFSALLEVLDPDQNKHFRDHYIELPLDLSQVLFLATANDVSTIPRPLLDRMEVIEVSGYTENEKFHIAKEHLIRKQFADHGITTGILNITDGALRDIIKYYTREAGVRELERKIGEICRKCAKEYIMAGDKGEKQGKISVKNSNLNVYLGKRKYSSLMANKKDEVGICRGLAWTSVGGETLQIEVSKMPGKGEIELTGQMGDVMKESACIALSYVRSVGDKYKIDADDFNRYDIHLHIPEGAVPKDGPSAGITMATAILSELTGRKVRAKVAMTGEITLRGKVLPIGGLKEKLLAARTAGIKKVLVPEDNQKDVEEISEEIIQDMEIVYVNSMDKVLEEALTDGN